MNKEFSIYDSPFSDETKKLRLNSLLATGLCLFIGITGELPEKFALFGVSFTSAQQNILGWFIFSVATYIFLHFISLAAIEIAKWIQPFCVYFVTKRNMLKHPAFDETDFMDIPGPYNDQDPSEIAAEIEEESEWKVQRVLRFLYNLVYLKLAIEILAPFIIGFTGLYKLLLLITSRST